MKKVFKGMNLVTGEEEKTINNAVVIVEDGLFKKIGTEDEIEIPAGAELIEFDDDVTMLPGLIDAHIHSIMDASGDPKRVLRESNDGLNVLRSSHNMKKTLASGVTWIRDLGGKDYLEIGIKEAIEKGLVDGPRMKVAGRSICMTGGHGSANGREADGVAEIRKATREQLKAGVDVIKFMATGGVMTKGVEPGSPQLTRDEMEAAVEEAHKADRKTATHAQGTQGIKNAILAGVDSIEHGIFLDDEVIEMMLERDVYLVPTLAAPYWIVEAGEEKGVPAYAVKKSKKVMKSHVESFKKALEAGVKIAFGTDAGTPFNLHGKNSFELKMMVDGGMTPFQAIQASCKNSAELLEIDDIAGTISTGKLADMVIIEGNPLEDIENLFNVQEVYKDGEKVI